MNDTVFYQSLGFFVYLLEDPRNKMIFYVGKGSGSRPLDHLREESDHAKVSKIAAIRRDGKEPTIRVLRHHLSQEESLLVESSIIDLLKNQGLLLTNMVSGHNSNEYGMSTWEELRQRYAEPPVAIVDPGVVLRINQRWLKEMSSDSLYDVTRGWWSIKPEGRRPTPKYAFAVAWGIIREVYKIERWEAASPMSTRDDWDDSLKDRVQFTGHLAPEVVRLSYRGKAVGFKQGSANPAIYLNC